jgi:hypothetical protein
MASMRNIIIATLLVGAALLPPATVVPASAGPLADVGASGVLCCVPH